MWRVADYEYELPEGSIAQVPADHRDASRLLVVSPGASGQPALIDRRFAHLVDLLPEGAVLVVNDARVIPARLRARKLTGGAVEVLLVEPVDPDRPGAVWIAMARSSKPLRPGTELVLLHGETGRPAGPVVVVVAPRRADGTVLVDFGDELPHELIERIGEVPLPPYIQRPSGAEPKDRQRYQTVYARVPGAVAAPTAGLHFTEPLLHRLAGRGITRAPLTLQVGLGTFAPVRVDDLREHTMHRERYYIPEETARLVASGRPVVAVGTTSVRALEAAARGPRDVVPGAGATDLFIGPGFRFRVVDHLITNFHLPGSTLLVLVAAFAGHQRVMAAYRHAVAAGYRFYSYGDAMLVSRASEHARPATAPP